MDVFCPFCGVKVEEEKKICNKCGNCIDELVFNSIRWKLLKNEIKIKYLESKGEFV